MFGPRKAHFLVIFDNFFKDFTLSIIAIIFLIVQSVTISEIQNEALLLVLTFFKPVINLLSFLTTTYEIDENNLTIKSGILNKKVTTINKETISTATISQSVSQQLFKVSKLTINNSAQSVQAEATMIFKSHEIIHIKSLLIKDYQGENVEVKQSNTDTVNKNKLTVNPSAFVYLGIAQSKISYFIKFIFGFMALSPFIVNILPNLEKDIETFFTNNFIANIENQPFLLIILTLIPLMILSIFIFYIISLVWSVISSLIKFYNFTLEKDTDKLHISFGLFNKKNFTIPKEKICGVNITQSLLMRMFGMCQINLYAIGYADATEGFTQTILHPFCKLKDANSILSSFVSDLNVPKDYKKSDKKAIRYYFYNFALILFLGVFITSIVMSNPYLTLLSGLATILMFVYIILSYKVNAVSINNDVVAIVNGGYSKRITIVPTHRIESITLDTTIFKKKRGYCNINLSYFAPQGMTSLNVKNIDIDEFSKMESILKL